MDENFSIINTNSRNEKIKNFFIKNKNKIIVSLVILIIIILGVFSYDKYLANKKKKFQIILIQLLFITQKSIKKKQHQA